MSVDFFRKARNDFFVCCKIAYFMDGARQMPLPNPSAQAMYKAASACNVFSLGLRNPRTTACESTASNFAALDTCSARRSSQWLAV